MVDKITSPMKNITGSSEKAASGVEGVGKKADESGKKLKEMSAIDLFAINDAVQNIAREFEKVNAPGAAFNAQLMDLSAITGVVGDDLEDMGKKGRKTAKIFGVDASGMLESYKGVLSKLGPGIADNQDALDLMGTDIATLSKTMKGDAVGAMNALTGSVLQFGSDIKDPMEMARLMTEQMNIMAASAKEGSAEVPFISQSIKQAGKSADSANVSFATTNAVIQAMGRATIYGSEAGVGFRNMLGKMAGADVIPKEALEKITALGINYDLISDKTVPFIDRLKELQKAQADNTLIAQIFGVENQNSVNAILDNIQFIEELEGKIINTNTATEQANVIMGGYNERMSRMKTWLNDIAIGMFGVTSKITPLVTGLAGTVSVFANMANAHKGVLLLFNTLKTMPVIGSIVSAGSAIASTGLGMITTAARVTSVAIMNIPILGWIAAIVAGLIALGAYLWENSETFRGVVTGVWEVVKRVFGGIGSFISNIWTNVIEPVFTAFYNVWKWVATSIWDGVNVMWEGFKLIGTFLFDNFLKPVKTAFEWVLDFVGGIIDKIIDKLAAPIRFIKGLFKDIAGAYEEGSQKGVDSYRRDHPEDNPEDLTPELTPNDSPKPAGAMPAGGVSPIITPGQLGKSGTLTGGTKKSGLSGSGSGGGGIKNISQKIEVKNIFNVGANTTQSEIEAIAAKVVRAINTKLSDGMVVAGA